MNPRPSFIDPLPPTPRFAARAAGISGSLIDSSIALLQGRRQPTISFAMGCPAADAVPAATIGELASEVLADDQASALNYGPTEGEASLRRTLRKFLAESGSAIPENSLLITTGATQGLDLAGKLFIDPGDLVIAEEPSYTNAIAIMTGYQGRILRCPMDDAGMQVERLPALIAAAGRAPKIVYVIPNSQNPGGTTMSLARRRLLLELAERFDFLILEDDPYGFLYFRRPPPQSLFALGQGRGRVIAVHSFSKIVAPGLRLGWVVASPPVIERMIAAKQGLDTCSNPLAQRILAEFLAGGHMPRHLAGLRSFYRMRCEAMLAELSVAFAGLPGTRWSKPDGGFFLWLELPGKLSSDALFPLALDEGVAFIPGSAFLPADGPRNALRLCFASSTPSEIAEGVRRLRLAVQHMIDREGIRP
jgi:2-aminoadipate transaminase